MSAPESANLVALHDRYRKLSFFPALDGLRCVSVVAVVWHHAHGGNPALPGSLRGFLGVDLFFVISGFLIVTLLLRERVAHQTISLRLFYARRTLRIFPPYYLVLAGFAFLYLVVQPDSGRAGAFFSELPYYLSYTSNWIPATVYPIAWSLAAEEQFYLVWPAVEKYLARAVYWVLGLGVAVSQLINFGVLDGVLEAISIPRLELDILQATFTPILLGVALAHLLHSKAGFLRFARFASRAGGFAVPGAWLLVIVAANVPADDISGLHRLTIQLTMVLMLAANVIPRDQAPGGPLQSRIAVRLGTISYGMYLYHGFAIHAVMGLLAAVGIESLLIRFASSLLLTIAVSEASYRVLEARLAVVRKRLRPVLAGSPG